MVQVTARVAVAMLPAASRAVTVMTLTPFCRVMPVTDQEEVPAAVPLPPRLLAQITWVTATLSEADPLMPREPEPVV